MDNPITNLLYTPRISFLVPPIITNEYKPQNIKNISLDPFISSNYISTTRLTSIIKHLNILNIISPS